jgi:hypothetical protein
MQKVNRTPKGTSQKEIMPKKSILKNEIVKSVIFSIVASISVIVISLQFSELMGSDMIKDVGIIFGIMVGIIPLTIHQLREVQRRDSIDRNMPVFLLALLSSVQSGSNLIKAIEQAAERNLGALTPELKNLRANISWGTPIEDSFENFAKRYAGTLVYSKAYLMLALAFLMIFGAEVTYFVYEQVLDLDPYPSIADVFFFMFYPFLIIYLIINIRFFAPQVTKSQILITVGIPAIITAFYINLTIADAGSFDFYYGMIFVAAASTTLSLSIHTARIFKGGLIGTAWLVLVIGIMLNVVGDT